MAKNVEGRVFLCSWKRVPRGFKVWVKNRPKLAATAKSFMEADEALADIITERTGDGENLREYSPAAPGLVEARGSLAHLLMVAGEGRATVANAAELFTGGLCPQCHHPRGARTTTVLRVASIEPGGDGAGARLAPRSFGRNLSLFSQEFIALLSRTEREFLDWRRVERSGRGKKAFYELAGSEVHVPFTTLAGGDVELWRCDTCGWESVPVYGGAGELPEWLSEAGGGRWYDLPSWYVSAADLPDPLPSCFVVGRAPEFRLCFTPKRWEELVGRPGTRGLKSYEVGIVARELADQNPRRRLHSEVWVGSE
jgi:hypothetical protein